MTVSESDGIAAVIGAQRQWSSAMLTNDAGTIAGLMHHDWAIVTPSGIVSAQQLLGAIAQGALSHSRMGPAPGPDGAPRVKVFSDIAVLTQRLLSTESAGGQTRDNDEWMTTVFVREQDRWLVSLVHVTPAAA